MPKSPKKAITQQGQSRRFMDAAKAAGADTGALEAALCKIAKPVKKRPIKKGHR